MSSDFPNPTAAASNSNPRSFSGKPHMNAPSSSPASAGKEAREDSEIFSDIVLSYISQILMEEDGDEKIDMLQEHPALLAAEKGFFDIIADSSSSSYSSSSSDHPLPTSIRSYTSSDDSLSPPGRNPNVPDSLADRRGLHFEYHAIACKWEELQPEELRIEEDEVLAVTCMYRLRNLADEMMSPESPRDQFLKTVRKLNPKVFVTGTVNGGYNSPFFATRFKEALFHFSALFDMMERNAAKESEERRLLEKHWFEKELVNVIACEGLERVERPETYKQWKSRNERAGLEQLPLDPGIPVKAREKLKSCYHKDFLVGEDGRWLLLGWKGRMLCALSAWKPKNV